MIISRKRFDEEVKKRVDEEIQKAQEYNWREERERERDRYISTLEQRLIECEKKCGIDHPSHHRGKNATAVW